MALRLMRLYQAEHLCPLYNYIIQHQLSQKDFANTDIKDACGVTYFLLA